MELPRTCSGSRIDPSIIRSAFLEVSEGYSSDRVICDARLNAKFLDACRTRGVGASAESLNRCLLNLRKATGLSDYKTTKRTTFRDQGEYAYAAEIAGRIMERTANVSIDEILCDPILAKQFVERASLICAGFTPLQYRWALLNLRKQRRMKPQPVSHIVRADEVLVIPLPDVDLSALPARQGIYVFHDTDGQRTLYLGESKNLRKRLAKHLDHSDNRELARWLWQNEPQHICLELHLLPGDVDTRTRRALESEMIRLRAPLFNIQGR